MNRYRYEIINMTTGHAAASEDFYRHVNSSWLEDPANAIPADQTSWGGFVQLGELSLERQIALARELTTRPVNELNHAQRVVQAIWEASQRRFDAWEAGESDYSAICDEMNRLNSEFSVGRSHPETLARVYLHCQNRGLRNVIDFDKGSDLKCAEHIVLDLSAGGLSLPSREYYLDGKFRDKFEAWQQHLHRVAELLTQNIPDLQLADGWAERVVDFETRLAKYSMTPDQSRLYDEYFTNTTLTGVYRQINSLKSLEGKAANYQPSDGDGMLTGEQACQAEQFFEHVYQLLDLRGIMRDNHTRNFGNGSDDGPDVFHLSVYDGDAVRRTLAEILDRDRLLDYRAYLQYGVIKAYATSCSRELDAEWFDFYSRTLSGQAQPKSRDKRSIGAICGYAGELMGQIYVDRYFPPEAKINVKSMIDEVLSVMRHSLANSTWLTPATAELALEKLDKFRVKIGYPDKWRDYSALDIEVGDSLAVIRQKHLSWAIRHHFYDKINSRLDREEWGMTPQTVNAYFHPIQNEIVFPAAILQPPFFHQSFDTVDFDAASELQRVPDASLALKAVNLGGIGAVIAHEITHGYDDQGRKFDSDGALNDWWTAEDAEKFTRSAGLMVPQTEQYRFRHPESGEEYGLNPMLTMGENLADLGGLSLSAKVLAGLTEDPDYFRLFFKSFANIWKCNMRLETRINRLTTDPHAPAEFRANLVKNIDWFYRAFEVKPGDGMYLDPEQRLCMW